MARFVYRKARSSRFAGAARWLMTNRAWLYNMAKTPIECALSVDVVPLEWITRNRLDTLIYDIGGNVAKGLVVADGPEQYESTLPISQIEQAVSLHGIEFVGSIESGGYICNYSIYTHECRRYTG